MIIKIPTVNDTYTGHVTECKEAKGKFGDQVSFLFANGDVLYMPLTSATNQLLRCGFDDGGENPKVAYEQVEGNTLTFSRSPNKTKGASPYYNISVAAAHEAQPKPASKRLTGPSAVPGEGPPDFSDIPLPPDPNDVGAHRRAVAGPPGAIPGLSVGDQVIAPATQREHDYYALAYRVAQFQAALSKSCDMPFDGSSVNAMTFSIIGGVR